MMEQLVFVRAAVVVIVLLATTSASAQNNLSVEAAATAAADATPSAATPSAEPGAQSTTPSADPTAAVANADSEEDKPLTIAATLDTTLGQGTFVASTYARNPLFAWSLGVAPSYTLTEELSLSAGIDMSQELTNSDDDTAPRQLLLSDATLGASYALWTIPNADVKVKAGLRFAFPTSLGSQTSTLVFSAAPSLSFSRAFGQVTVSWATSFKKNFHQYTSPVIDTAGLDPRVYLARAGGNEDLGESLLALGGNNTSYSFSNTLSAKYSPMEELSVGISFKLGNSFTYESYSVDDRSSPYAVAGRGQRDSMSGALSGDYTLNEMISLSAGISTASSPMNSDMSGPRFPFWDFESTAENLTTFGVGLTVSESFATGE